MGEIAQLGPGELGLAKVMILADPSVSARRLAEKHQTQMLLGELDLAIPGSRRRPKNGSDLSSSPDKATRWRELGTLKNLAVAESARAPANEH